MQLRLYFDLEKQKQKQLQASQRIPQKVRKKKYSLPPQGTGVLCMWGIHLEVLHLQINCQ